MSITPAYSDLRILTAILANRLNRIIGHIIHPDQTGFISERYYGDNTKTSRAKALFLSLDTSWRYLTQTLKWFKFKHFTQVHMPLLELTHIALGALN